MDFQTLAKKERENIEFIKSQEPDFFKRAPQIDTDDIIKQVGIAGLPKERPVGYIKLWPEDFIVEEIDKNQKLHTVFSETEKDIKEEEGNTIYADLVKVGMSSIDAQHELSQIQILRLDAKHIGMAGIKDRDALTSQLVSFRNIPKESVAEVSAPHFFLKNIAQGKGAVQQGELYGNRFTIAIRLPVQIDLSRISWRIETLFRDGFWNFYYLQRFGTPRLLTHIWGFHILRGDYGRAVKTMILREGAREVFFFKDLRSQAGEKWGKWSEMAEVFSFFPLSFRSEITVLQYLAAHPDDFKGALAQIPQQVQLGVYAYSSFLFNSLLSTYLLKNEPPPKELPLFLSRNTASQALYKKFFEKHGLRLPSPVFRDFPFIQWKEHIVPTKIMPILHGYKILDEKRIVLLDFSLTKGSYATSLLMHLFTLSSGQPALPGISVGQLDVFELLGKGSLEKTMERFRDVIFAKAGVEENE